MDTDTVICWCEEVMLSQILSAINAGAVSSKAIKLETRTGMGICQGRICRPLVEQVISSYTSRQLHESPQLNSNHPVRPLSLNELAGNRKDV
ncbi:(2Fe-2S)-binding protein [Lentibacillus sp. CBA3610]|uniref:(2Fe-2S)-binding protein n=1 Tax=Lentibacillus sp. CBA3610 TaxID=2518176 RepID=UPI001595ABDA|nr:(2Fe-2S)-binding protein [Lentibacillus sp. CBA3610]QKY68783.1 (2Fe-2S)-binding protein [Lentibacillus sp. CBA3610]